VVRYRLRGNDALVAQPHWRHEPRRARRRKAEHLGVTQHGLQRKLQVHVVGCGELDRRSRKLLGIVPQVCTDPSTQNRLAPLSSGCHRLHEILIHGAERADVRKLIAHDERQ
jgi:hypothetical protein